MEDRKKRTVQHFKQIDKSNRKEKKYFRRCNDCVNCKRADCGKCKHCLDMPKFGGSYKLKKACFDRQCEKFNVPLKKGKRYYSCDICQTNFTSHYCLSLHKKTSCHPKGKLSQKTRNNSNLNWNTFVDCGKSLKTVKEEHFDAPLSNHIKQEMKVNEENLQDPLFISNPLAPYDKYNIDEIKLEVNKESKIESYNTEVNDRINHEGDNVDNTNVNIDVMKNDITEHCDVPNNVTFKDTSTSFEEYVDYQNVHIDVVKNDITEHCYLPCNDTFKDTSTSFEEYVDYQNVHIDDMKNDITEHCDVPNNVTSKDTSSSFEEYVDYKNEQIDTVDENQLEFEDIDKVIETMSVEDAIAFFSK